MKITKIVQQEKRKDRYAIFIDNDYAFSLGEIALLESKLIKGQELTRQELKNWQHRASDDKIYGLALRYAALRPRSKWEMEVYLSRKNASPTLTKNILNKLSSIGLLDDAAFAQAHVIARHLLRPTSKRKLQQELRAKHVSDEIAERAINESNTSESDILRRVIAKKRQLSKYKTDDLKLMQYLARQGFNYEDIQQTMHEK